MTRVKSRHPSSSVFFEINLIIRDMKSEKEIWKPVVGLEYRYMISSLGRVKRLAYEVTDSMGRHTRHSDKIMKVRIGTKTGYPQVNLWVGEKSKPFNIHRLIAEAFIPNPNNYPCVNHIDEDRSNSVLGNLEWCTYEYNSTYGSAREKRRNALKSFYENHPEFKINVKKRGNSFKVNQYTLDGALVKTYDGGIPEIHKIFGRSACVSSCVTHKNHSAYGFVWRYDGDPFSYEIKKHHKKIDRDICRPLRHQKYVLLIDDEGNTIERFASVSAVGRKFGFDRHKLSTTKAINGVITIGDYRFIVEKKENEFIPVGHKGPRPDLKGKGSKAVLQISFDGKEVAMYNSIIEAAESLGKKSGSDITNCCRGKIPSAFGYKWRYANG